MIINYVYPRFSYFIDDLSFDSINRYADIVDNEGNTFLSSTGCIQRFCFKLDFTATNADHKKRNQLFKFSKILSYEDKDYLQEIISYIDDKTIKLVMVEPSPFHKTYNNMG